MSVSFNISLPNEIATTLPGPGERIEVEDPEIKRLIREAVLKAAWALPYKGLSDDGEDGGKGYCASLTDGERIVLTREEEEEENGEDGGNGGGGEEEGDGGDVESVLTVKRISKIDVEEEEEGGHAEEERPDSSTLPESPAPPAEAEPCSHNNTNDNTAIPDPFLSPAPSRADTYSITSSFYLPPPTTRITVLVKDILGTIHPISMRSDLASTSRLRAKYSALVNRSRRDILLFTAKGVQMVDGESLSQYFLDASSSTVLALRASAPTFPAGVVRASAARGKKKAPCTAPLNALPRGSTTSSGSEERRGLLDDHEDEIRSVGSL